MDVDLILDTIFEEYKAKAIKSEHERKIVEERLEAVQEQVEAAIRDSMEDFIGRPNNESTVRAMRNIVNQHLNKFLDTDINLDAIEVRDSEVTVNMTYKPKMILSSGIIQRQGSVVASAMNPAEDIITHSL